MEWMFVVDENSVVGQCHATTLVETGEGDILCAWFGGAPEKDPATSIWLSRRGAEGWSEAVSVADQPTACWNPVLYRHGDQIMLFYKAGESVPAWAGILKVSEDGGTTWGEDKILPAGIYGPIKNKPIPMPDERLLCGSSAENYLAWTCWMHIYDPDRDTWQIAGPIEVEGVPKGVIQPTVWETSPGHYTALMRSTAGVGKVCRTLSFDGAASWITASPMDLPNNNSGLDAVKLADGRVLLVYNHTTRDEPHGGRYRIHLAVSEDDGARWSDPWLMEDEGREYSYPAVIQAADGTIHLSYTHNRVGVRYATLRPNEVDMVADGTLPRP